MKKILQIIIAISCMPFVTGVAVAADPSDPYTRYSFDNGTGFERMGFGFAQPIITIIPGYGPKDGSGKLTGYWPVAIIAGGYDPTKDYIGAKGTVADGDPDSMEGRAPNASGSRHNDKVGNAVYFVSAITGELVARVRSNASNPLPLVYPEGGEPTPRTESDLSGVGKEKTDADLKHSIPATVTIVDSQGDGVTDRVYFIDVIGNIWRLDLIAPNTGEGIAAQWKLNKFASLGSDSVAAADAADNDRRFFNQIDVVRTRRPGTNYNVDALLVGSGNIANPKEKLDEGDNKFFVIYDENTQPITREDLTTIKLEHLFNASAREDDDLEKDYLNSNVQNAITGSIKGWYWNMRANEKIVSAVTTIEGVAYFTTIVASPDEVGCQAPEDLPASYLYALDMHTGESRHFDAIVDEKPTYKADRYWKINSGLAFQQIDPYVSDGGNVEIILPDGTKQAVKDSDGEDRKLEGAGSYWRTEDQ
mgnify:CR=1 FL=1